MLGRIKILTNCLSSSNDGRSREDMTATSDDSSKCRSISKIPKKKKIKKKKKQSGEEDREKGNSDEKSSSGTEVGKSVTGVKDDEAILGMEKKATEEITAEQRYSDEGNTVNYQKTQ